MYYSESFIGGLQVAGSYDASSRLFFFYTTLSSSRKCHHSLRIVAQKKPTPVLALLRLTQAGLESVISDGFSADLFDEGAKLE